MTICSAILTIALFLPTAQEAPTFTAKLYAAHESVAPGGQTELLVEIDVADPWHIYHPIILDTGLATDVQFTTPAGVTIGDLRFPVPAFGEQVGLEYLEHTGKLRCVAPLRVAADVPAGKSSPIGVEITGLACIEACLPVETAASLTLPITAKAGKPAMSNRPAMDAIAIHRPSGDFLVSENEREHMVDDSLKEGGRRQSRRNRRGPRTRGTPRPATRPSGPAIRILGASRDATS